MRSLRHHVKVIIGGAVSRGDIISPMITAELVDRLQTCSPLIHDLHIVVVTIGSNGKSYLYLITNLQVISLMTDLPLYRDTGR